MSRAKRKSGLGRGLDALLSESEKPSTLGGDAAEAQESRASKRAVGEQTSPPARLPIGALHANPHQPRKEFAEEPLDELTRSIREQGIIQPIVVQPTPDSEGAYTILAGERRWRAATRAGLTEVPVVVRDQVRPAAALQLALVENLQRADLNPLEEADAYRELREEHGLTQEQIAAKVGKSRVAVANQLRLLRLPDDVLKCLREGKLSAGQARPLLRLPHIEDQVSLAGRAMKQSLSAREIERLVARQVEPAGVREGSAKRTSKPPEDVHLRKARERLTRSLQTRVEITTRQGGSGQVRIHFHSQEELMRIYELLVHQQETTSVQK